MVGDWLSASLSHPRWVDTEVVVSRGLQLRWRGLVPPIFILQGTQLQQCRRANMIHIIGLLKLHLTTVFAHFVSQRSPRDDNKPFVHKSARTQNRPANRKQLKRSCHSDFLTVQIKQEELYFFRALRLNWGSCRGQKCPCL